MRLSTLSKESIKDSITNKSLIKHALIIAITLSTTINSTINSTMSFAAPPPAYGSNTLNQHSSIATNVAPFNSWSPGWVLVDAFAKSQDWVSTACDFSSWGNGPAFTFDDNRWIRTLANNQCAYTSVFANQAGHYPAGTYVMLFEGDGFFVTGPADDEVVYYPGKEVEITANGLKRLTFTVDQNTQGDEGIPFFLMSQQQDYIHNIRLITPGGVCGRSPTELNRFKQCQTSRGGEGSCAIDEQCYDYEQVYFDRFSDSAADMDNKVVFHPEYIQHYQQYNAIRYMKWSRAEDSTVSDWDNRVTLQEAMFTLDDRGFPYEYMIAMSNQLNADGYFNIPVMADPNYVQQYGAMVDSQLHDNLDTYIEYGNEFFNTATPVPWGHALAQANLLGSGIPATDSDFNKVAKWSSRQAVQVMNQWRAQFDLNNHQVTRVIAGFNAIPSYTHTAVEFEDTFAHVDALAMSGYIGPDRRWVNDQTRFDNLTLDEVFEEINDGRHLQSETSIPDLHQVYVWAEALAGPHQLALILYEAGQHIVSTGTPAGTNTVATMIQANKDSRMGTAYTSNFTNFRSAGGTLIFNFVVEDVYDENGTFGLLQYQDDNPLFSPKYQAVTDYINNNPCWWSGCSQ